MTLPHIEQKHNSNQTSLQYIGNLTYHQGKSATSYDSVNSLTTHNNYYTLLYPALVQELFNFSLHKRNTYTNILHFLCDSDKNLNKSSNQDDSLSPRDILFFLQIVSLYQLELRKGNSSITYPSLKLAKILGVDISCDTANLLGNANMRAFILKMTAKLESLGLLKVCRRKRNNGMDKANKLIPILPDKLYARIKDSPANLKISDSSKLDYESNLDHILRTKLFIPIELEFMKHLFKDNVPPKYKLFFLNCIMSAYRNFRQKSVNSSFYDSQGNFIDLTQKLSFSATSRELMKKNNISRSTLDRIFRYVKQQGDNFFLKVEHKYTRTNDIDCNRYDKSIFVISINPLVFPISSTNLDKLKRFHEEELESGDMNDEDHMNYRNYIDDVSSSDGKNDSINHDKLQGSNSSTFADTYEVLKTVWSKKQPSIIKKTALNNKDIIIQNKDIDYIDANSKESSISCSSSTLNSETHYKEEFFEDKLCLSSSEFYNNSSFFDNSSKSKNVSEQKELRHFYPISEKDISILNSRANREFSTNFVNQLLLKLYIKYPEKRFKNKFTFLSYMEKILANEKHQGPLVNHTTFRFGCNIGTEEKNILEYEKYLNQIESSLDTSKEMCAKKKIAGRFNSEVAYKILTQVEFKKNHDHSFITALVPSSIGLSERQIEILGEQLEAVHGINGYYVQETEDVGYDAQDKGKRNGTEAKEEIQYSEITKSSVISNNTVVGKEEELDTVEKDNVWHKIRKGLIEELGENIDNVWFSKAVAVGCQETKTLTLTMPTRFMADFMRNNYSYVIRRLASSVGIKSVEYVKM
ncbi:DnaA N-terminal domain-containing protein [Rickettsia gravesii]|uniref:DnaA N-terminal domain-containing protein n=1 Tax=Rickettsia gravesii TaxID=354585 RepID=UPI00036FB059|nr:DnaA N-terminal domain-containing protein [Rickettsia gravesii]